jgi:hypothetical protein
MCVCVAFTTLRGGFAVIYRTWCCGPPPVAVYVAEERFATVVSISLEEKCIEMERKVGAKIELIL